MRQIVICLSLILGLVIGSQWGGSPLWAKETKPAPQETAPASFEAGREYVELPQPHQLYGGDQGQIEVAAFFWYGCGTCSYVERDIQAWAEKLPKDVKFTPLPATFNPMVKFHARLFLTLEALGLGEKTKEMVFGLFQAQHKPINRVEQLPELAKFLKIDEKKLIETFNSPQIEKEITHLDKMTTAYGLPGVPAMVIDGRYLFDIGTAHGLEGYLQLADILIEKQRVARTAAKGK